MSRSVAIDPAGFIPTKVNTVRLSEEETVPPLPREQWDKSDSLLQSSFLLRFVTAAKRDPNAGLSVDKVINQKSQNEERRLSVAKARGENLWQPVSVKKKKEGVCGKANRSSLDNKVPKNKDMTCQENQDPQRTRVVVVGSVLLLNWLRAAAGRELKCWSVDKGTGSR